MDLYEVQLILLTEFGEYFGKKVNIDEESLNNVMKISKTFYMGGFELTTEDDSKLIFSPDIIKKSILTIKNKKINNV